MKASFSSRLEADFGIIQSPPSKGTSRSMAKEPTPAQGSPSTHPSSNQQSRAELGSTPTVSALSRKIRTAASIYKVRGWSGIRDQIAYIFRGRIGASGRSASQDEDYKKWAELHADPDFSAAARQSLDDKNRALLKQFLDTRASLEFATPANPEVSIVLVLHNRAALTLACLYSLLRSNLSSYEVIIVDNASTDQTQQLLQQLTGARILHNDTNVHYLRACNQAARLAQGQYLLLLNNDAEVEAGSIRQAIETLESSADIGAVGGKVILPDGTLQEAGSIIWQDGSCLGYGRGDYPLAPAYMFQRDVDYCSGVFLLTKRKLFLEEGGFDEAYLPAYYEETGGIL